MAKELNKQTVVMILKIIASIATTLLGLIQNEVVKNG